MASFCVIFEAGDFIRQLSPAQGDTSARTYFNKVRTIRFTVRGHCSSLLLPPRTSHTRRNIRKYFHGGVDKTSFFENISTYPFPPTFLSKKNYSKWPVPSRPPVSPPEERLPGSSSPPRPPASPPPPPVESRSPTGTAREPSPFARSAGEKAACGVPSEATRNPHAVTEARPD